MDKSNRIIEYNVSGNDRMARYHYACKGAKTYIVIKGSARAILNGKAFILTEGDIFNAEAWCPYSLSLLEDDTIVREISGVGHEPDHILPDPASCIDVDKAEIGAVICKDEGIYRFKEKGITLLLKVGRWQLDGLREIWEFRLKNGYRLAFNDRSDREGLYMIRGGLFRVEVGGKEYIAGSNGDDIVRIPAETAYSFTALSDECVMLDFDVSCHLFRLLEMVEAARDYFPEKLNEQAYIDYLFEANKVVTFESFEKEEN